MEYVIEKINAVERQLHIKFSVEAIQAKLDQKIDESLPKMKIPGFRRNKVPRALIVDRFGPSIYHEIVQKLCAESLDEVFRSDSIKHFGSPELIKTCVNMGEPVEYFFTYEVQQEIEPVDFSQISVMQLVVDASEEDIDFAIEKIREERKWFDSKAPIAMGDKVVLDLGYTKKGPNTSIVEDRQTTLIVGDDADVFGISKQVLGAIPGTRVDLELVAGVDGSEVPNQDAILRCSVLLKEVKREGVYAFTEEDIKELGVEEGTMTALRAHIASQVKEVFEDLNEYYADAQIIRHILEKNTIIVTQRMVDHYRKEIDMAYEFDKPKNYVARAKELMLMELLVAAHDVEEISIEYMKGMTGQVLEECMRYGKLIEETPLRDRLGFVVPMLRRREELKSVLASIREQVSINPVHYTSAREAGKALEDQIKELNRPCVVPEGEVYVT